MSLTFSDFFYTQLILKIPKPTANFASKTIIITGGNRGLGKEAAKHIVSLGAEKVILACRDVSHGQQAKLGIESATECGKDIIEVLQLDLESPDSIKDFAAKAAKLPRLDVLINNAGIQTLKFETVQGTERTMMVNVIGTFLLSISLLPKLQESAKTHNTMPHMTFVSSALASVAKYPEGSIDDIFAWLGDKSNVNMMDMYNLSKLFQRYLIQELDIILYPSATQKESDNQVIINSMDPCFCNTDLSRGLEGGLKVFLTIFKFLFARTQEEGSRLVVQSASAGKESQGGYMRSGELRTQPPLITDQTGLERSKYLWDQLSRQLEKIQPGIMANVKTV